MNRTYLRRLLIKKIERANELRALLVLVIIVGMRVYRLAPAAILYLFPPHPRFGFIETPSERNTPRVLASAIVSGTIIIIVTILLASVNPINILLIPGACLFFMGVLFVRRAQLRALMV